MPARPAGYGAASVHCYTRSPRPLVDKESRVIAVLGGRPSDVEYLKLTEQAATELEKARGELKLSPKQRGGRRGAFSSVMAGISFGGGQLVHSWQSVCHSRATMLLMHTLSSLQCFFRISGFANGLFKAWNPAVHALYVSTLDALTFDYNPALKHNFERKYSAFAAATLNFGPRTVTLPHIDALNLAWGWCAITALGFFNPDAGGHLVLWDLKLIIRFPPGSTILIPSAILRHSNIPIQPGESRYSFTQFTAAGLFRWVDNGFKSDTTVASDIRGDVDVQEDRARARQSRWVDGIGS
ncbi:hypothetical protein C8R43DRAFT_1122726 [Mycena crocata]|nr:hypothetical protein C8R43DRAFT_1122726 [Mycena crocata]